MTAVPILSDTLLRQARRRAQRRIARDLADILNGELVSAAESS
jgi:hypothetical protein